MAEDLPGPGTVFLQVLILGGVLLSLAPKARV